MTNELQKIFISKSKKYFMSYFQERSYPLTFLDLKLYSQQIITRGDSWHRRLRTRNSRQLVTKITNITSKNKKVLTKVKVFTEVSLLKSSQLNDNWFRTNLIDAVQNQNYTFCLRNSSNSYFQNVSISHQHEEEKSRYSQIENPIDKNNIGSNFDSWKKLSIIILTPMFLLLFIAGVLVHRYTKQDSKPSNEAPQIISPTNSHPNTLDYDKCYSPPPQMSSSPSSMNLTSPQSHDAVRHSVSSEPHEIIKNNNDNNQRPLSLITHNDNSIPPLVVIENIDENFSPKEFLRHSLYNQRLNERGSHTNDKQELSNNLSNEILQLETLKRENKRGLKHKIRPFSSGDEKYFFPKDADEELTHFDRNRKRNPCLPIKGCSPSAQKILLDCNIYDPNQTKKNVSFKTEPNIPRALVINRGRINSETSLTVSTLGDGIPLHPNPNRVINTHQYTKRSEGYDSDVSGASGLTSISNFSSGSKLDVVALNSAIPQNNYKKEKMPYAGKSDNSTSEKKNIKELQSSQSLRDELSREYLSASFQYTFDAPSSGKLGIIIESTESGGPRIHTVKDYSPLFGFLDPSDLIIRVDDEDTSQMNTNQLTKLLSEKRRDKKRQNEVITISILSHKEKLGISSDSEKKSNIEPNNFEHKN